MILAPSERLVPHRRSDVPERGLYRCEAGLEEAYAGRPVGRQESRRGRPAFVEADAGHHRFIRYRFPHILEFVPYTTPQIA